MNTLPNQQPEVKLTETEAYEFIKYNWNHGKIQQAANYSIKSFKDLTRIGNLSRVLNIPHPDWKENELYKLITNEWEYFRVLGVTKDFTPLLSYKAITHILMTYNFEMKVDYSKLPKASIKKTTSFKYTEDESLAILKLNESKMQESMGREFKVNHLVTTSSLSKMLKLSQTCLYSLLKENLAELELLGCVKTTRWSFSYQGILFLLLNQHYPLEMKAKQPKVVNIQSKQPVVAETKVTQKEDKPNLKVIKQFLEKRSQELKAKAEVDKKKAEASSLDLKIVEEVYWHFEQAEELLQEIGL